MGPGANDHRVYVAAVGNSGRTGGQTVGNGVTFSACSPWSRERSLLALVRVTGARGSAVVWIGAVPPYAADTIVALAVLVPRAQTGDTISGVGGCLVHSSEGDGSTG